MADQEWHTTGRLPIDLSDYDPAYASENTYEPGECSFRCLGWNTPAKGKGKPVAIGFLILDGPGDKHSNKGKRLRKTFNRESEFSMRVLKGVCLALAGEAGLVAGQPDFNAIAGVEFKAILFERGFTDDSGKARTGYEINFETGVKVLKKAAGAAAAGAPAGGGNENIEPQG